MATKHWKKLIPKVPKEEKDNTIQANVGNIFNTKEDSKNTLASISQSNATLKKLLDEQEELQKKMEDLTGKSSTKENDPRNYHQKVVSITQKRKEENKWEEKKRKRLHNIKKKRKKEASQIDDKLEIKFEKKKAAPKKKPQLKEFSNSILNSKDRIPKLSNTIKELPDEVIKESNSLAPIHEKAILFDTTIEKGFGAIEKTKEKIASLPIIKSGFDKDQIINGDVITKVKTITSGLENALQSLESLTNDDGLKDLPLSKNSKKALKKAEAPLKIVNKTTLLFEKASRLKDQIQEKEEDLRTKTTAKNLFNKREKKERDRFSFVEEDDLKMPSNTIKKVKEGIDTFSKMKDTLKDTNKKDALFTKFE